MRRVSARCAGNSTRWPRRCAAVLDRAERRSTVSTPVATDVSTGPTPSLRQLARIAEDFPTFAVVVADQREAVIWLMERRIWQRSVEVSGTDYPRHQQQGGWSQRRYQARADERIEALAKTVADETRR